MNGGEKRFSGRRRVNSGRRRVDSGGRRVWARGAPASFAVGGSSRSEAGGDNGAARVGVYGSEGSEQARAELFSLSKPLFLSLKMIRNE